MFLFLKPEQHDHPLREMASDLQKHDFAHGCASSSSALTSCTCDLCFSFVTPVLGIMWRILATLLFTAVAEFTPDQLEKMADSVQSSAESLQDKVESWKNAILPLSSYIPTFGSQMMAAADEEQKAAIQKQFKANMTKMCNDVLSLSEVLAQVSKASADARETVTKVEAQMVMAQPNDPAYQNYLDQVQKSITSLDATATSGAMYTSMKPTCQAQGDVAAATRLFLEKPEVAGSKFHLPSALLGALGATVIGSALVLFRTKASSRSQVVLMEEGNLE